MGQQLYRLPQDVIATVQAGEALHAEWGVGEPSGLAGRTAVPLSLLLDLVKQHRSIRVVSYYSSSGVPSAEYVTLMRAGGTTARAWAEKRVMQDTVGPVYVSRPVVNAPDIVAWAKSHGYRSVVPAESMHVTIAYSRAAVDWSLVGCADDVVTIPSSPARSLREFSDDAKVLVFESEALRDRHLQIRELGASWDHPEYHPHITLTRGPSPDTDALEPYDGPIVLGPELLAPLSDDWRAGMVEKMIRAEDGKWVVYDHEGERRLGAYDTRAEAVSRLAQIEAHKKGLNKEWDPDQPRDDDGKWSGGGGGGDGSGGDGGGGRDGSQLEHGRRAETHIVSRLDGDVKRMVEERLKRAQEAPRQSNLGHMSPEERSTLLRSLGHSQEDIDHTFELLRQHSITSEGDDRIAQAVEQGTGIGAVLDDMASYEEAVWSRYVDGQEQRIQESKDETRRDWEMGFSVNRDVYSSWEEEWKGERSRWFKDFSPDLKIYRAGSDEGPTQSWTDNKSGANMGAYHLDPDRVSTLGAMRAKGYRPVAGISGLIGAPGEGEVFMVRFPSQSRKSSEDRMQPNFERAARVVKVDEGLGLVMGYAIVCTKGGRPYYDLQGDHIPESAMLKAATDFMSNSRLAKDMHDGEPVGDVLFAFPLTGEVAKAFGITTDTTGLMIAMRPGPEMLAKFKSGEYTGFSIGGRRVVDEEVD